MRWVLKRKIAVLDEINAGLSEAEACAKYDLSLDEIAEWKRRLEIGGTKALLVTKTQSLGRETNQRKKKVRRRPIWSDRWAT